MSQEEFEKLGEKVIKHLGVLRRRDFHLIVQMFELKCTALSELNAFLLLEEITVLMSEMKNPLAVVALRQIYNALKLQAYGTCRIVVQSA